MEKPSTLASELQVMGSIKSISEKQVEWTESYHYWWNFNGIKWAFYQVLLRLTEIFDCKTDEEFARIPIIVCGDLFQLPPLKEVPICLLKDDRLETLPSYNLWSMFSLIELTEAMKLKQNEAKR